MDRRLLQYRTDVTQDTTEYWQTGFLGRLDLSSAPAAEAVSFVRVGLRGQLRREEIVLVQDTGMAVPDTLTAAFGLFAEYQDTEFRVVAPQFNGAGPAEDLDISLRGRPGRH